MAIERAVVKGTLFDVVQVRNMFTAEVTPAGGDTSPLLWDVYLQALYADVMFISSNGLHFYAYDLQTLVGAQWETTLEVEFDLTGPSSDPASPNAVAWVLLGKAAGIRHVGRKFFSGITEPGTIVNTLSAGALVYAANALLSYVSPVTGIGGGSLVPGVVTNAGVFHPFVGGVVSSLLGSMRRRKPGIGI